MRTKTAQIGSEGPLRIRVLDLDDDLFALSRSGSGQQCEWGADAPFFARTFSAKETDLAICACPMDAAPQGTGSKCSKMSSMAPSSRSITLRMTPIGSPGT